MKPINKLEVCVARDVDSCLHRLGLNCPSMKVTVEINQPYLVVEIQAEHSSHGLHAYPHGHHHHGHLHHHHHGHHHTRATNESVYHTVQHSLTHEGLIHTVRKTEYRYAEGVHFWIILVELADEIFMKVCPPVQPKAPVVQKPQPGKKPTNGPLLPVSNTQIPGIFEHHGHHDHHHFHDHHDPVYHESGDHWSYGHHFHANIGGACPVIHEHHGHHHEHHHGHHHGHHHDRCEHGHHPLGCWLCKNSHHHGHHHHGCNQDYYEMEKKKYIEFLSSLQDDIMHCRSPKVKSRWSLYC